MSWGKLLIIEDDVVFAATLSKRLTKHGLTVEHCAEAQSALDHARRFQPEYILLDMKLAGASGLMLVSPLRISLPACKIVLLTGFASIATAVEAVKLGADDYLAKPTDTNTILSTLTGNKTPLPEASTMSPEQLEWEHINKVLLANEGNVSATARQLNMHRRTLQRKLQKKPR